MDERHKMAGQSSWGSGMPWGSGCTGFIEEKEARLPWAQSVEALTSVLTIA